MLDGIGARTAWSVGVAVVASVAVFLLGHSIEAALVALVGGVAAALVATGPAESTRPRVEAERPDDRPSASVPAAMLDTIAEPILLVDAGRVALANAAARALLGEHIVGDDVRVAIRHPAAAERLAAAVDVPTDKPVDLVGLGALDQHWQMRVGETADGTRVVHLVDQTGHRAAERMRVDFVANASHELRTPLAAILGFVETLREEAEGDAAGADPATRARFLRIIDDEARRMERLVGDLISLSRIEADKYRAPGSAVDLAELVAETRGALVDVAGERGLDLVAAIDPGVPPVAGDRAQLSQLLHNLVGNALKYGRSGTPVTVALRLNEGGMVRLCVADRGEGIDPKHLPRLTERFYRVDAGRSRTLGGTGLGLAIVKHIVERHRGRLDIASVVGEGTTVTVLLPVATPAATSVIKP